MKVHLKIYNLLMNCLRCQLIKLATSWPKHLTVITPKRTCFNWHWNSLIKATENLAKDLLKECSQLILQFKTLYVIRILSIKNVYFMTLNCCNVLFWNLNPAYFNDKKLYGNGYCGWISGFSLSSAKTHGRQAKRILKVSTNTDCAFYGLIIIKFGLLSRTLAVPTYFNGIVVASYKKAEVAPQ